MTPLVIRADSTTQIGVGHIMRCIALGQSWQDHGGKVVFISHCESAALRKRLVDEGFDLITLKKPYPDPFDLEHSLNTLRKLSARTSRGSWIVVDGYHFDSAYQKGIKEAGHKLLWMDDYGHAEPYCADIVLNQNITADESLYAHREPATELLLGTRYALLRREFKKWQGRQREIPAVARKVLVTLGGGDPGNVTLKVLQALKQVNIPELEAKIVAGPANPNLTILAKEMGGHSSMEMVTNAANMPQWMMWADVAVSAGGSTCWETANLGLPNVILYFAENQRTIAEKLHEAGAVLSLGWSHECSIEETAQEMESLLLSQERRRAYSENSKRLVDGFGSQRVCQRILNTLGSD